MNWLVLDFQSNITYVHIHYIQEYIQLQTVTYICNISIKNDGHVISKNVMVSENWIVRFLVILTIFRRIETWQKLVQTGPKTGPIISVRNFSLINGRKHEKSWNFLSHDIVRWCCCAVCCFLTKRKIFLSKVKFISDAQFNKARTSRV